MRHDWTMTAPRWMSWGIATLLIAGGTAMFLYWKDPSLQQRTRAIQTDIEKIRGRAFVAPVVARYRSREGNGAAIETHLARLPEGTDFGKVVRKLGLHNGPLIEDSRTAIRQLVTSPPEGGLGYYDEKLDTVFVEKTSRGEIPLERLAHEIHHAFQHQHFDLTSYLVNKSRDGSLNTDEAMARRAVVEGEATYVAMLWQIQHRTQRAPTPQLVSAELKRRSRMDRQATVEMLSQPNADAETSTTLAVLQRTPDFVYESLYVPYRSGAEFVAAVRQAGWSEVDKLYSTYPPESTEQILHPEKWFAREAPLRVKWPAFDNNPLFAGWRLLADNVLGEALWRTLFKEQGLRSEGRKAARGWNGDRYAVFERESDGALLLLWHTAWDTPTDASEFASLYRRLLETKPGSNPQLARVKETSRNVFIVEGSDHSSLDAYMAFVEQAR
jgi:hypothetical protein